jgi:hypothetical protein
MDEISSPGGRAWRHRNGNPSPTCLVEGRAWRSGADGAPATAKRGAALCAGEQADSFRGLVPELIRGRWGPQYAVVYAWIARSTA